LLRGRLPACQSGLKTLRPQERVDQIGAQHDGNDSGKDVFHMELLEAVATPHVRPTNQEKQDSDDDEKQIEHNFISP
jgi:hypothetical protein